MPQPRAGPVFTKAESLIQEIRLDERYKDLTFEMLNYRDFLESVKGTFPDVDWAKAHSEFKTWGQSKAKDPRAQ